jgi:integrase/recombinase XerD
MTKHASVSRRLDGKSLDHDHRGASERRNAKRKQRRPLRGRAIGKAKVLPMEQVPGLIAWLECLGPQKESAQLVFGLSFFAGLRVAEIAGLTWRDVTDHLGNIAEVIRVPPAISKYNKGRDIPMHPCIAALLVAFGHRYPDAKRFAINGRGEPRNAGSLSVWFYRVYQQMGLEGCSSHSGRRSLITYLANNHGQLGMSLKDVQLIAGHARLETTEAYIEPSIDLHRLVNSVPWAPRGLDLQMPAQRPVRAPLVAAPSASAFSWDDAVAPRSAAFSSRMNGDRP